MTGYNNGLNIWFEENNAKDEAYAELKNVRYESSICDMFTKI
jgi:hypothetical protein